MPVNTIISHLGLAPACNGAAVGDLFMSVIHTCELNDVNPFEYLTALLRHPGELKQKPYLWKSWNYRETLARAPNVGRHSCMRR